MPNTRNTVSAFVLFALRAALAGEWIAGTYQSPEEDNFNAFFADASAPVLSRRFDVPTDARRVELKIAVAGLCDVYVNGLRLSSTPLSAWTDYGSRILEDSYDLLPYVKCGAESEIRLEVGNGWYNPLPWGMWGCLNLRKHLAVGTPCVKGQIVIEDVNGSSIVLPTDSTWLAADGTMVFNSIYRGERRDFRCCVTNWAPARVVAGPKGAVLPRGDFPRVVVTERLKPRR